MRILKKIFKIFMILLIILFVGITVFFMTFDLNSYRGMIVTKATEALGRPVSIDSISMKMSLIPTVEVKGVKIDNPAEFNQPKPFVQIDSMDVTLALIPLLSGNVELKDFNLSTANIILIDKSGKNNWTFGNGAPAPKVETPVKPVTASDESILSRLKVDNIAIKKLSVSYTKDDKTQAVTLLNASIKQLKLFSLSVMYDNKTIKLSGNLGDIAGFLAKKPNYTFSLTAEAFGAVLKTSGTIGDTANLGNIVVNLSATGKNLHDTVASVGQDIAQIPNSSFVLDGVVKGSLNGEIKIAPLTFSLDDSKAKLALDVTIQDIQKALKIMANGNLNLADKALAASVGVKPMQVKFDVVSDMQSIVINTLDVAANKSDIALKGNVSLKDKVPDITAQVSSNYLDAEDFIIEKSDTSASQQVPSTSKTGPMFSDAKIDLSALKSVNAVVTVAAKTIKVPEVEYIGVNTAIRLRDGNLSVSDLTVRTPAGTIAGNAVVNASQTPAQIAVKVMADDLKLDTFKPVTAYVQGSMVSANINVTTAGDSVKAFVSNLNGQILMELSEGTIVDKWFNSLPAAMGMIKSKSSAVSFSSSDQVSKLTCGVVNLNIKNGLITSKDQIAIETSAVNFAVSGNINLPAEQLSLTMVPSLVGLENNNVQRALQLTQIVKIEGPFTNLKPSLDGKKTTEAAAKAGLEVLAGKLAEKQGIELPSQKTNQAVGYNLCEKALGRPLKGQKQNRPVPQSAAEQQPAQSPKPAVVEQLPPKEQFKRQLMNSLSEALKK